MRLRRLHFCEFHSPSELSCALRHHVMLTQIPHRQRLLDQNIFVLQQSLLLSVAFHVQQVMATQIGKLGTLIHAK